MMKITHSLPSGGPWDCEAHQGTITGVPAGSNRKFVILGKDSSGNVLYRGETTGRTVSANQLTTTDTIVAECCIPMYQYPYSQQGFLNNGLKATFQVASILRG
jgi:hypothetical protein